MFAGAAATRRSEPSPEQAFTQCRAGEGEPAPCHSTCHTAQFVMPKQKTHSGAKKRFKVTGSGKVRARHAMTSHILEKKSAKRKRKLGTALLLSEPEAKRAKKLLGAKTR